MKLTRPILDFYVNKDKNKWYLKKYFTNTNELGIHRPNDTEVVSRSSNGKAFAATVDEHNTYEINDFGFRGKIYEDAEVLASGCSVTFGIGLPESGRASCA
jgi:hypothetical protein